jgi:hypothetical protein
MGDKRDALESESPCAAGSDTTAPDGVGGALRALLASPLIGSGLEFERPRETTPRMAARIFGAEDGGDLELPRRSEEIERPPPDFSDDSWADQ